MFEGDRRRARCSPSCERERRAIRLRVGGEQRWVAADEAGLYRDALRPRRRAGCPRRSSPTCPTRCACSSRATRARTGRSRPTSCATRYGVDAGAVLRELERDGDVVRGELRPGGSEREWCDVEVLRRLRRASLAALRKEIEPAEQQALAAFLPAWQGIDRHPSAGAGIDRLREVLVPLQGLALPAEIWERDVLPRRTGAYSPSWLDQLCASGELVWVGAGPLHRSGRVALYFREDAPLIGPPASAERRGSGGAGASRRLKPPSTSCCARAWPRTTWWPRPVSPDEGRGAARFGPGTYHNGSTWPMDTGVIADGLRRHGRHDAGRRPGPRILRGCAQVGGFPEVLPRRRGRHRPCEHRHRRSRWSTASSIAWSSRRRRIRAGPRPASGASCAGAPRSRAEAAPGPGVRPRPDPRDARPEQVVHPLAMPVDREVAVGRQTGPPVEC